MRILIVEDEPIISTDIALLLQSHGKEVVGKAYSSTQALDMIKTKNPDLVLLDISIKGDLDGVDIAKILTEKHNIPYIYITSYSDNLTLNKVKETKPIGYIVKPFKDNDIITAIELGMHQYQNQINYNSIEKSIVESRINHVFTKTEWTIVQLIWDGISNQDISEKLFVSVNTVKTHLQNVYSKCGVKSRAEMIAVIRKFHNR